MPEAAFVFLVLLTSKQFAQQIRKHEVRVCESVHEEAEQTKKHEVRVCESVHEEAEQTKKHEVRVCESVPGGYVK